ncbi:MAG: AI-2E family transporter [Armatimonadota bacterium]
MNPKAWVEGVFELIWRVFLRLALWGSLGYFLYRVRSVVVTILLAAVLTYAVLPIVDALCAYRIIGISRKFQRLISTLLVFVALITSLVFLTTQFITPFRNELGSLSEKITASVTYIEDNAAEWRKALPPDVQEFILAQKFENTLDKLSNWGTTVVNTTFDFLSQLIELILIPVLAFYFVLDSRSLKREFIALMPRRRARETIAILHEINSIMRSYVIGQIILCLIAGVVVAIMLYIAGMHYELILGIFAAVTRAVPVLGPIVSGIVIVLMGLTKSPILGVNLLIFFSALHFIESKFIMPKLIGDRMQLHPALIILVLLIGAEFFGVFGMFMAAPVAAVIRVLVRYYLIKPRQIHVWGMPNAQIEMVSPDTQINESQENNTT